MMKYEKRIIALFVYLRVVSPLDNAKDSIGESTPIKTLIKDQDITMILE